MMKRLILPALLFPPKGNKQVWVALAGMAAGLFLMGAGLQTGFSFRQVMQKQKDLLGGEFLVINKPVSLLNTLSGKPGSFTESEIRSLQQLPGIQAVGQFTGSRFKVGASFSSAQIPGISTEMFFEAVPDAFLDADARNWQWEPGMNSLPVIIPADYLRLYNFGFAQGQGLPLIPESILSSVQFEIRVSGNGRQERFKAGIAGFTERISSILVPQSFLEYANKTYGDEEALSPGRLIVKAEDPGNPTLSTYFAEKGYEIAGADKLKTSRINTLLKIMMGFVLSLAIFMVVLSLLGIVQSSQILVFRSARDIRVLHQIGHTTAEIARPLTRHFYWRLLGTGIFAMLAMSGFHYWLYSTLGQHGFRISALPSATALGILLTGTLGLGFVTAWSTQRAVQRICQTA
jgi:hypothetical protein